MWLSLLGSKAVGVAVIVVDMREPFASVMAPRRGRNVDVFTTLLPSRARS